MVRRLCVINFNFNYVHSLKHRSRCTMDPTKKEWEQYENPQESVLCKRVVNLMRKGVSPEDVTNCYDEWAEDMNYEKVSVAGL